MTLTRTTRRTLAAPALAVGVGMALALGLSACGVGQITQTATQVAAVPGANVTVGDIALRNLQIAYNGPGGYPAGANAPLQVRIFNSGNKTVRLIGVTAQGVASVVTLVGGATTPSPLPTSTPPPSPSASPSVTASAGPTESPSPGTSASPSAAVSPSPRVASPTPSGPAGQSQFSIEIPALSYVLLVPGSGPHLQLNGLTTALIPGQFAPVRFTFDSGATCDVRIPFAPPDENVQRGQPVVHDENKAGPE